MGTRTGLLALGVAGLALGVMAATTAPWNWGTAADDYTSDPSFAASKAVCRKLGAPVIPAADRPNAAETAALKDCNSEALYYGEGMAADYVKARQCAVIEDDRGDDDAGFFGGRTMLMQIYANGLGVPRNLDLATALACSVEAAPAENDGRVVHLQGLAATDHFDVCDDITSGYAGGFCAGRESTIAGFARDQKIDAVVKRLPPASTALFAPMKTAFDAFTEAHSGGEVDLSGSARVEFEIEAEDAERDQFFKDLTRLADGQWPAASHADAAAADAGLNQHYRASLDMCKSADNSSTVTVDDVRAAQRAWLVYRDAYVKFAGAAAPKVGADAILARLTKLRMAELDDLPCN